MAKSKKTRKKTEKKKSGRKKAGTKNAGDKKPKAKKTRVEKAKGKKARVKKAKEKKVRVKRARDEKLNEKKTRSEKARSKKARVKKARSEKVGVSLRKTKKRSTTSKKKSKKITGKNTKKPESLAKKGSEKVKKIKHSQKSILAHQDELKFKGKLELLVCGATGCRSRESLEIIERLKEETAKKAHILKKQGISISIKQTGCHGFCQIGPTLIIMPHGLFYVQLKPEDAGHIIDSIIHSHIIEEKLFTENSTRYPFFRQIPFFKHQQRVLMEDCGFIDPLDIDEFIEKGGFKGIKNAVQQGPDKTLTVIQQAKLRGRGGAGFPTHLKWKFLKDANPSKRDPSTEMSTSNDKGTSTNEGTLTDKGTLTEKDTLSKDSQDKKRASERHISQRHITQKHISQRHISQRHVTQRHISQKHINQKYIICNADEGDPGAFMDRGLIESNPLMLIEGMLICAYVTGATKGIIYIRQEYPLAEKILRTLIPKLYERGFLGKNVFHLGFDFDLEIKSGAGAFVCGEETALIRSLEGRRGQPRPRPPYPAQEGLYGCPTNINNVKTLCSAALIMRHEDKGDDGDESRKREEEIKGDKAGKEKKEDEGNHDKGDEDEKGDAWVGGNKAGKEKKEDEGNHDKGDEDEKGDAWVEGNKASKDNKGNEVSKGAEWFLGLADKDLKDEESGGTILLALSGKVKYTGLVEVGFGKKLSHVIERIGGGSSTHYDIKAVQTGGPSGGCLPYSSFSSSKVGNKESQGFRNLRIGYKSLQEAGSILGSGGMIVLNEKDSIIDLIDFFLEFLSSESCGQCTPCREGLKQMSFIVKRILEGEGCRADLKKLEQLAYYVKENSLCGLGQTSANPVLSSLRYFKDEYIRLIEGTAFVYEISKRCTGCHKCAVICPVDAIDGEINSRHYINQDKCIHCGSCYRACPIKAIERVRLKRID